MPAEPHGIADCSYSSLLKMITQLVRPFVRSLRDAYVLGIIPAIQGARATYGRGRLYFKIRGGSRIAIRRQNSDYDTLRQVFEDREYSIGNDPGRRDIRSRYADILSNGQRPIIIDAGANIGLATLWFKAQYPKATVIAIEPDTENFAVLKENVIADDTTLLVDAAVGSRPGLVRRHGMRTIMARPRRVHTTDSRHDFPIAANLLERNFIATAPNRIWLADITYVETDQGWLYLATVMDLYSRKIVGWAMADHLRAELPLAALAMAIATQRPGAGLIHHSDRGVQYASAEYRKMIQSAGFRASMSRRADCYDNAPMESFFHTLKTELVHHQHYATREDARRDIFAYIEGFYNRTRRHSSIGYLSPIEMELKAA